MVWPLGLGSGFANAMHPWDALQGEINACAECKRLGSGLIIHTTEPPARPPAPSGGELLFISEAPPPDGGFWAAPPAKDDLRRNMFSILKAKTVPLPDSSAHGCLTEFHRCGFLMLQTVKWPLCVSARGLRPTERRLIEHSVEAHLASEIDVTRPCAIIAMGRVAAYACGKIFNSRGFDFPRRMKLEDVRGSRFEVASGDRRTCLVYPTGLPVKRRAGDFDLIANEIGRALTNRWDAAGGRVRRPGS